MWSVNYVVVNDGDVYVAIVRCGDVWEAINVIDERRMDWDTSWNVLYNRCLKYGWTVTNQ
jgi:hypothetical protein